MSHSSYLDSPLLSLAIALPRMLGKIEDELTRAEPEERRRLEMRAQLIRELLGPNGARHR